MFTRHVTCGILHVVECALTFTNDSLPNENSTAHWNVVCLWGLGYDREKYLDLEAKRVTREIQTAIRLGRIKEWRDPYHKGFAFSLFSLFFSAFNLDDYSETVSNPLEKLKAAAVKFLSITINGVLRVLGDILRAIQEAQIRLTQAVFANQRAQTCIFKAHHKPLQVIPESIRPIDSTI